MAIPSASTRRPAPESARGSALLLHRLASRLQIFARPRPPCARISSVGSAISSDGAATRRKLLEGYVQVRLVENQPVVIDAISGYAVAADRLALPSAAIQALTQAARSAG